MTTKAIEAGARADLLPCPFCGKQPILDEHPPTPGEDDSFCVIRCAQCGVSKERNFTEDAMRWWNTRASGELVSASAVAAERERCIKAVRDERLTGPVDSYDQVYNKALDHAEHAIRSLSPEPASGEFVVVPRIPTNSMIRAGDDAGGGAGKRFCTPVTEDVWTAMLRAATKDGERK